MDTIWIAWVGIGHECVGMGGHGCNLKGKCQALMDTMSFNNGHSVDTDSKNYTGNTMIWASLWMMYVIIRKHNHLTLKQIAIAMLIVHVNHRHYKLICQVWTLRKDETFTDLYVQHTNNIGQPQPSPNSNQSTVHGGTISIQAMLSIEHSW